MNPVYTIVQEFLRIEALGTTGASQGTPADPIRINAYVCPSDELGTTIESRDTAQPGDDVALYRVTTGNWAFKLTPGLYTPRKSYTINFRYWSTPENLNVVRKTFVWEPVPDLPHNPGYCVVFGTLRDVAGFPVAGERLVVERYTNMVTLNEREAQNTIQSNAFGLWSIELPIGAIIRVVLGDISRTIKVPPSIRCAFSEAADYQPAAGQCDAFGYPFPRGQR